MEAGQKRPLINELTQGIQLANQLKHNLMSPETCEFLVEKILSSYEKALSMVTFGEISQVSSRKRKTVAKWNEQVKVCSGSMVEGPLSDGYSWRKYGQKDILGANHPRAYYRCSHRNVQGCLATKQVQRSDEDLSVFEVSYRGRHTCIQATHLEKKPKEEQEEEETKPTKKICLDRAFSFKTNKGVNPSEEGLFPSFSFESQFLETELYLGTTIDPYLQSSDSDLGEMINSTPNSPLMDVDFDGNFLFDITDLEMFA